MTNIHPNRLGRAWAYTPSEPAIAYLSCFCLIQCLRVAADSVTIGRMNAETLKLLRRTRQILANDSDPIPVDAVSTLARALEALDAGAPRDARILLAITIAAIELDREWFPPQWPIGPE
jgi:hypothetical protein